MTDTMKRYFWILLAILAFAGCKNDKKKTADKPSKEPTAKVYEAPTLQETKLSETINNTEEMSTCDIEIDVEYYEGGNPEVTEAINDVILRATFGDDCADMGFDEAKEYTYGRFMADMSEGIMGEYNEYTLYGSFSDEYENYLNYTVSQYEYFGGVHGMDTLREYVFDKTTGALVTEDDLFVPGYENVLSKRMTDSLRNQMGEEFEFIDVDEVEPNGNFIISPNGITWLFNAYEIASYAMGAIDVTLSWDELQDLLKQK